MSASVRAIAATVAMLALHPIARAQSLPVIHVAVVLDGRSDRSELIRSQFQREITAFFADEYDVRFEDAIAGDWTVAGVRAAVDRALAVPTADVVIALGPLSSHDAARREKLRVPVIACFVIDATLQELPRANGTSGVRNLSYLDERFSVQRNIQQFKALTPFRKLAVLINPATVEAIPQLAAQARRDAEALGGAVEFVTVSTSAAEGLRALPADADAVFVSELLALSREEFDALVAGVNARRLPSFSYIGREEVERGILAAYAPRDDMVRRARRVASTIQRILDGENAGEIEVDFTRTTQLTINMATARAIGFSPTWPILTEAELIHAEEAAVGRELTLESCAREAVRVNLDLAAARKDEQAGRQEVTKARARLLPQVGVSASDTLTRGETAEASFGTQPERIVEGDLGIRQSIYSEQSWASYSIEKRLQEGRESVLRGTELDVVLDAASAYLSLLRVNAVARIQRANLRVSLSNLDLARIRESIGAAGRSDVYRWESEVATNRRNVLDADANIEVARVELNRLLNRPLEERFVAEETTVNDRSLITGEPRLFGYFASPRTFAVFRDFMVTEAWATSPELRELDAAIAAQKRAHTAAKRAYWVPDVGLEGGLNYVFDRSGAGSSGPALPPPIPADAFATLPDYNWSFALGVSLPLFTGFARRATVTQTSLDLERIELERESVANAIAQRVRTALHLGGASFAGIEQARVATEASRQNLDIVTEAYGSGTATIVTLIDAQNSLLVAEQAATDAVYNFLLDLMQVERAIGRFYFLQSPEEQRSYFQRLDEFYQEAGVAPGRQAGGG